MRKWALWSVCWVCTVGCQEWVRTWECKARNPLLGLKISAELVESKRVRSASNCRSLFFSAVLFFFLLCNCGPLLRLNTAAVQLDICVLWMEGGDCGLVGKLEKLRHCWETWALCRTVPETGRLMEVQQDLGSAFIVNVRHLLGWKESPQSWRKLCQLTDETVNVNVCMCVMCVLMQTVC